MKVISEEAISAWWDNATVEEQERVGVAMGYSANYLWRREWWIAGWYGIPQGIDKPYRIPRFIRARLRYHIIRAMRFGIEALPHARKRTRRVY